MEEQKPVQSLTIVESQRNVQTFSHPVLICCIFLPDTKIYHTLGFEKWKCQTIFYQIHPPFTSFVGISDRNRIGFLCTFLRKMVVWRDKYDSSRNPILIIAWMPKYKRIFKWHCLSLYFNRRRKSVIIWSLMKNGYVLVKDSRIHRSKVVCSKLWNFGH